MAASVFTSKESAQLVGNQLFGSVSLGTGSFTTEAPSGATFGYGSFESAALGGYVSWTGGDEGLGYYGYISGSLSKGSYNSNVFIAKDTSDLFEVVSSGVTDGLSYFVFGGPIIELDGPTAKDFQAKDVTGNNLLIAEDTELTSMSFGTIYSELVKTNEYSSYTFKADDFELGNAVIDGETYTAQVAGVSASEDGQITINTNASVYDSIPEDETVDVAVGFEVTDPNGRSDTGTLKFSVSGKGEHIEVNTEEEISKPIFTTTEELSAWGVQHLELDSQDISVTSFLVGSEDISNMGQSAAGYNGFVYNESDKRNGDISWLTSDQNSWVTSDQKEPPGYYLTYDGGSNYTYIGKDTSDMMYWLKDNDVSVTQLFGPAIEIDNPENISISTNIYNINDSDAQQLTSADALKFNSGAQTLNNYLKDKDLSTDVTANNSTADVFAVKDADKKDGDNFYILDVSAKSERDGFNIDSFDITLDYDSSLFNLLDVGINGSFGFFNSAKATVEDESNKGRVRVVGGSASNLADEANYEEGIGGGTTDGNTFQLLLEAKHVGDNSDNIQKVIDTNFEVRVNSNDTVLSNGEEIINGSSTELKSTYSFANSFVDFEVENDIKFATERNIGVGDNDQKYTSLVRAGSTLKALGDVEIKTAGNISAGYYADIVQTQGTTGYFSVQFNQGDKVIEDDYYNYRTTSGTASHVEGAKDTYELDLWVSGDAAGKIINLSDVTIGISETGNTNEYQTISEYDATTKLLGQNLVTYQSDINYDGRVSMMDLAYLNAGAGSTEGSTDDVDVNYDGEISLKDLEKMDAQWGSSLHTNNAITNDKFSGTNNSTIDLSEISLGGNYGNADNSAFISQNSTENTSGFVDTLAEAGSAGYSAEDFTSPYGGLHDASPNENETGE